MTRLTITEDDVSPLLEIFIWLCLVIPILTFLIRIVTKRYLLRRADLDDYLLFISLVWRSRRGLGDFNSRLADFQRSLHLLNQSPSLWLPQMVLANVSSPWIHISCLDY